MYKWKSVDTAQYYPTRNDGKAPRDIDSIFLNVLIQLLESLARIVSLLKQRPENGIAVLRLNIFDVRTR